MDREDLISRKERRNVLFQGREAVLALNEFIMFLRPHLTLLVYLNLAHQLNLETTSRASSAYQYCSFSPAS